MPVLDLLVPERHLAGAFVGEEGIAGQCFFGPRRIDLVVLPLDEDFPAHPKPGVLLCNDLRAGSSDFVIRSRVLEVPVCIEENSDWTRSCVLGNRFKEFRGALWEPAVYQQSALWAANSKHVSA